MIAMNSLLFLVDMLLVKQALFHICTIDADTMKGVAAMNSELELDLSWQHTDLGI